MTSGRAALVVVGCAVAGWTRPGHADDGYLAELASAVRRELEAAAASHGAKLRPPLPVAPRWQAQKLGSLDLGAPLVAVFGPTDPARNGPWSPEDEVVRRIPACAPCHKRSCDIHQDTMKKILPGAVLEAATRRLASSADRNAA